ncbi:hypothetical protein SPRG_07659 [Saprolegnia parasitica CBS 223.65]|uniref:Uncharacterized protein n=1 Tax=Saprolegnia parasitica (strain CBS 223.65) TaxID=695850 RepID=A0A067CK71_SAPPC|nr:hypothetical protein SPRG_07659 [Saprolegnia parasitica CBS 223.65]KDO26946.1 hypothetical protein SPRG_07659 [Saprolegnia parasitica CBS 223.65]|eukprot:XP_012202327.1 hypothetical protein SPRG_07659 [Saprolegnia parasitica CBS 223.65]
MGHFVGVRRLRRRRLLRALGSFRGRDRCIRCRRVRSLGRWSRRCSWCWGRADVRWRAWHLGARRRRLCFCRTDLPRWHRRRRHSGWCWGLWRALLVCRRIGRHGCGCLGHAAMFRRHGCRSVREH